MPAVTTIRPGQPGAVYASALASGTTTTWAAPGRQRAFLAADTSARARRAPVRAAASTAAASRAAAASAADSDAGSSRRITAADRWPSEATSGIRSTAVDARRPSAAVLSAARATPAPVSSQVPTIGGRRVASGQAPAAAHNGSTSGR